MWVEVLPRICRGEDRAIASEIRVSFESILELQVGWVERSPNPSIDY